VARKEDLNHLNHVLRMDLNLKDHSLALNLIKDHNPVMDPNRDPNLIQALTQAPNHTRVRVLRDRNNVLLMDHMDHKDHSRALNRIKDHKDHKDHNLALKDLNPAHLTALALSLIHRDHRDHRDHSQVLNLIIVVLNLLIKVLNINVPRKARSPALNLTKDLMARNLALNHIKAHKGLDPMDQDLNPKDPTPLPLLLMPQLQLELHIQLHNALTLVTRPTEATFLKQILTKDCNQELVYSCAFLAFYDLASINVWSSKHRK